MEPVDDEVITRSPAAGARDVRRRAPRRGLASDRLARDQRQPSRAPGDARPRVVGDARAQLPPQLGRAGAGHGQVEHPWRGHVRHHSVRPGSDVVRGRARGARGRLLHHRGKPQGDGPVVGAGGDRAAAAAGRRRTARDHAAGAVRRGTATRAFRRYAAGGGRSGPQSGGAGRGDRPDRRCRERHQASARARARDRLAYQRPDELHRVPAAPGGLARDARGRRRRGGPSRLSATGARARATSSAGASAAIRR